MKITRLFYVSLSAIWLGKWGDQTWEEMQYTGHLFSPALPAAPPQR